MKVEADRELCIQAGNCVMVAPEVFDQDDDGIVVILSEEVEASGELADRVREAVKLCPSGALSLAED
ncbi:MAG: ferredoxin [Actinomycetota bacterium]|nr:ferredoxin [Actinomycetota bacterium]